MSSAYWHNKVPLFASGLYLGVVWDNWKPMVRLLNAADTPQLAFVSLLSAYMLDMLCCASSHFIRDSYAFHPSRGFAKILLRCLLIWFKKDLRHCWFIFHWWVNQRHFHLRLWVTLSLISFSMSPVVVGIDSLKLFF